MNKVIVIGNSSFTVRQIINIIKSRTPIIGAIKTEVEVSQVTPYRRPNGSLSYIVNLKAMTAYHAEQAKEKLQEEDYQGALNQNVTYTIFCNENDKPSGYLPQARESVIVDFGYHINKNGEKMIVAKNLISKKVEEVSGTVESVFGEFFPAVQTELGKINEEANAYQ